jgi:hypothetical protein
MFALLRLVLRTQPRSLRNFKLRHCPKTKSQSTQRAFSRRTFQGLSIAVLVALATGCADVNRLREAQDSFNQAAASENALRFDTKSADATASLASARSGYASALLSLEKLENSKGRTQLRNDGLWGTALTLKALTQWRLGQFDKAIATAELARQNAGDQMYPRDLAMITALPGLVKTDQAYDKILRTNTPLSDITDLLVGDHGAVADIQNARGRIDRDHPVQVYLLQAQLAAYRNFQVALDRRQNHATVSTNNPAFADANAQLKELNRLLKMQNAGTSGQDLVDYWRQLCGLDRP